MTWIESHQSLGEHPKRKKLSRLLGIGKAQAVGHLHCLWWWVLDYAEDGDLSRFDPEDIAEAAAWDGEAQAFIDAMAQAGFLDCDEKGLFVHDHDDYAGRLVSKRQAGREANRERQQRFRVRHRDERVTERYEDDRNANVTRDIVVSNGPTQHNKHNTTEQNPTTTPPTPLRRNNVTPSRYETQLNKKFSTFCAQFASLDPLLDESWLRQTLRRIEADVGDLPPDRLAKGLGFAHRQIDLRLKAAASSSASSIHSPRRFAETVIVSQLKEQRDGPASPAAAT